MAAWTEFKLTITVLPSLSGLPAELNLVILLKPDFPRTDYYIECLKCTSSPECGKAICIQ